MIYFGFDLGDGESCVAWSRDISANEPTPIAVAGDLSFTSAVALLNGEPVIGRLASAENESLSELRVCFKRHFLENREDVNLAVQRFARGVMAALRQNPSVADKLADEENVCFIVGCPAGWQEEDRARYRQLLTEAGMPNVRLASESRAAFENALRRRVDGVEPELIEDCVLVIDIGSSTLDLAYVCDGQEHQVEVMGDVKLGGGLMDEMIVQYALDATPGAEATRELRAFLQENPAWHSRVMLEARAVKERYFVREEQYFQTNETIEKFIRIPGLKTARGLTLSLSPEIVESYLTSLPHPLLDGQSFKSRLRNTLKMAHQQIRSREPKLVILTGGPSRMRFFREMCQEEFADSRIVISGEPEFDIARGLAYAGSVDEGAALLLRELREYVAGDAVEEKVEGHMEELISDISDTLGGKLMKRCVLKTFRAWRSGELETLQDFEEKTGEAIANYLKSADGQQTVESACRLWTALLMNEVQQDLDEIARKHGVTLGQLQSGRVRFGRSEDTVENIDFASQLVSAVQTIVTLVTGVVMAMICGGAGTALIATGVGGIVGGVLIALAAAFLGRDFVRDAIMTLNIPNVIRRLFPDSVVSSKKNQAQTADKLCRMLTDDPDLTSDLARQISRLIDDNLTELLRDSEVQFVV